MAVIAVVVLGAGGWWVMKTRAETETRTRLAEAKRKADEEEKIRVDAAAKAEQERLNKLSAQLRGELAEYKVAWEVLEREERNAERRLSELKSDTRNLRDVPANKVAELQALLLAQQDYYDWLSDTLARNPARVARGRAEEMLSGKQFDLAQAAVHELKAAIDQLKQELPKERAARLAVEGPVSIRTDAQASWTLTDAFDRTHTGQGPAQVDHVAFGPARIEFTMTEWPVQVETPLVSRSQPNVVVLDYTSPRLIAIRDALRAKAKADAKQAEQARQAEAARVAAETKRQAKLAEQARQAEAEEARRQADDAEIARRKALEREQQEQLRRLEARGNGGY